jgi:hypothetical protein
VNPLLTEVIGIAPAIIFGNKEYSIDFKANIAAGPI